MNHTMNLRRAFALVALLVLAGCAELAYRHMNDPSRDEWQQPKAVIQALAIAPGTRVADLGAGGGYFTWPLAEAVGPTGLVYAVDINETGLRMIEQEAKTRHVSNVKPVLAEPTDAKLPESVDIIFSCDTYHHISDRTAYFATLARSLTPGGRIAIIDYTPSGFAWLFGHSSGKETVRLEMEAAGYRLEREFDFLSKQHFQVFSRKPS
jgi:ubiquinone/menaquinone biosynthesis C-methylase UbiE